MTIRENKFPVKNVIQPQHILVSVFDKTDLAILVNGILNANPAAQFYSTGGTGEKVVNVLGPLAEKHYTSVEAFTGAPEMDGGLVKTLHPKVHAGLLAERNNPKHEQYLAAMGGVYFDVMVGNLYPFTDVVAKPDCTAEQARINIDIGGPAMIMAAAKNWHSVAVISNPNQYHLVSAELSTRGGLPLSFRFLLAQEAMRTVGSYRSAIGQHFGGLNFHRDVLPGLQVEE
ncbi:hypothetical protein J4208_00930 [Candidatus Woesearchaeota archaeon]|nr:hypothetical protein [Candidatus Woesearchaeota archaeon]